MKGIGPVTLDKVRPFLPRGRCRLQPAGYHLEPLVLERKPHGPGTVPARPAAARRSSSPATRRST